MTMRLSLALLGTLLATIATAQVAKQPPGRPASAPGTAPAKASASAPASPRLADEAAINANDEAFVKAFNAGNARALAATFTDDAEVIDEENHATEGREAIRAQFAAYFETNPGAKLSLHTESLKFLGPETALLRGRAEVAPSDGSASDSSRYTVVFVKRDGKWLQASVRDEYEQAASNHERLKPLEWLVGEWVSESDESLVSTTCEWADNKSYLLRSFTVQMQGKPAMTGQQRIGWDPLTRQFKSWVFDSEGGYGEGFWSHDGDRWSIKAHGVRHDGKFSSATQVVTRVSKDMIRWKSVDRTAGGKAAPDVDEFVLVRKPPKPR
jgi:uncharacterized protein (TIGR02246 family)